MNYEEEFSLYLLEGRASDASSWEKRSLYLRAASEVIYSQLVQFNKQIDEYDRSLIDSSNLLYPTAGLNLVWMLSTGYAIECLIKAIIIATTTESVITLKNKFNIKIFGNESRSHDLYYLLSKKIDSRYKPILTPEQNAFLIKMTAYIIWRGKYPVPKEPLDQLRYLGPDSEKLPIDLGAAKLSNDKDKASFTAIFDLLYAKLQEAKESKT